MPVNIERRKALSQALSQFPLFLIEFSKNTTLEKKGEMHAVRLHNNHPNNSQNVLMVAQCVMAQFCGRLIKTRCQGGHPALEMFSFETINRYIEYRDNLFPDYHIVSKRLYLDAINQIQQNASDLIFETLRAEIGFHLAEQDQKVQEEAQRLDAQGETNTQKALLKQEEFDEISFWRDVFLAIIDLQKPSHPNWRAPIEATILNFMGDFEQALNNQ